MRDYEHVHGNGTFLSPATVGLLACWEQQKSCHLRVRRDQWSFARLLRSSVDARLLVPAAENSDAASDCGFSFLSSVHCPFEWFSLSPRSSGQGRNATKRYFLRLILPCPWLQLDCIEIADDAATLARLGPPGDLMHEAPCVGSTAEVDRTSLDGSDSERRALAASLSAECLKPQILAQFRQARPPKYLRLVSRPPSTGPGSLVSTLALDSDGWAASRQSSPPQSRRGSRDSRPPPVLERTEPGAFDVDFSDWAAGTPAAETENTRKGPPREATDGPPGARLICAVPCLASGVVLGPPLGGEFCIAPELETRVLEGGSSSDQHNSSDCVGTAPSATGDGAAFPGTSESLSGVARGVEPLEQDGCDSAVHVSGPPRRAACSPEGAKSGSAAPVAVPHGCLDSRVIGNDFAKCRASGVAPNAVAVTAAVCGIPYVFLVSLRALAAGEECLIMRDAGPVLSCRATDRQAVDAEEAVELVTNEFDILPVPANYNLAVLHDELRAVCGTPLFERSSAPAHGWHARGTRFVADLGPACKLTWRALLQPLRARRPITLAGLASDEHGGDHVLLFFRQLVARYRKRKAATTATERWVDAIRARLPTDEPDPNLFIVVDCLRKFCAAFRFFLESFDFMERFPVGDSILPGDEAKINLPSAVAQCAENALSYCLLGALMSLEALNSFFKRVHRSMANEKVNVADIAADVLLLGGLASHTKRSYTYLRDGNSVQSSVSRYATFDTIRSAAAWNSVGKPVCPLRHFSLALTALADGGGPEGARTGTKQGSDPQEVVVPTRTTERRRTVPRIARAGGRAFAAAAPHETPARTARQQSDEGSETAAISESPSSSSKSSDGERDEDAAPCPPELAAWEEAFFRARTLPLRVSRLTESMLTHASSLPAFELAVVSCRGSFGKRSKGLLKQWCVSLLGASPQIAAGRTYGLVAINRVAHRAQVMKVAGTPFCIAGPGTHARHGAAEEGAPAAAAAAALNSLQPAIEGVVVGCGDRAMGVDAVPPLKRDGGGGWVDRGAGAGVSLAIPFSLADIIAFSPKKSVVGFTVDAWIRVPADGRLERLSSLLSSGSETLLGMAGGTFCVCESGGRSSSGARSGSGTSGSSAGGSQFVFPTFKEKGSPVTAKLNLTTDKRWRRVIATYEPLKFLRGADPAAKGTRISFYMDGYALGRCESRLDVGDSQTAFFVRHFGCAAPGVALFGGFARVRFFAGCAPGAVLNRMFGRFVDKPVPPSVAEAPSDFGFQIVSADAMATVIHKWA